MSIKSHMKSLITAIGFVACWAGLAEAGPPLICHPFDAGSSAQLLPWGQGQGWNTPSRNYDVSKLTADTMRLLTPDAPILARMENLRRATIYAATNQRAAAELLAALLARAQNGPAPDALALFDAGYLIESYRQARHLANLDMLPAADRRAWKFSTEPAFDGYALVRRAIATRGPSPEMEFAASLMREGTPASIEHRRRAEAGAASNVLLAKNLETSTRY